MSYVRPLTLVFFFTFFLAVAAAAQVPQPVFAPAPAGPEFLSRYDFHMTVYHLNGSEDPAERFSWDTHFGGSFDILDYVLGRACVNVDYEAVLGSEFRPFDPNQANYTLEPSLSVRLGETELAAVFHHESRHLSDRPKHFAIAWNMWGGRLLRRATLGSVTIDGAVDVGRVVQHSFVDYTWLTDGDVLVRRPVSPRLGVFVHGSAQVYQVDGTIPNRGTQFGTLVEAGLRVAGRGGALEMFAGFERRVDAYPLDRVPQNWVLAGFRLLSR
jgi:hypothetical protein